MEKQDVLKQVGKICKSFRQEIGETQVSVAKSTNYSVEVISHFENGRTNNMYVFLWYMTNGMDLIPIFDLMCEVETDDY